MSFFWFFLAFAFVGIFFGVNIDSWALVSFGFSCALVLLFWVCYVFIPYVLWANKDNSGVEWEGFFAPPFDLRQKKQVKSGTAFEKRCPFFVAVPFVP